VPPDDLRRQLVFARADDGREPAASRIVGDILHGSAERADIGGRSYGHADLFLERHWQMMGALEALNGMMLFGLTTAFLFALIQKVWPLGSRM
jgi:hypothetical protein